LAKKKEVLPNNDNYNHLRDCLQQVDFQNQKVFHRVRRDYLLLFHHVMYAKYKSQWAGFS